MYTSKNFKTKKALKAAVDLHNRYMALLADNVGQTAACHELNIPRVPEPVTLYAPGLGKPNDNGTETVEGPHYPAPHTWYAQVTVENGIVVKVK